MDIWQNLFGISSIYNTFNYSTLSLPSGLSFNGWRWKQNSGDNWQSINENQTVPNNTYLGMAISNTSSNTYFVYITLTDANGFGSWGGAWTVGPGETPTVSTTFNFSSPNNPYFFKSTWQDNTNGGSGDGPSTTFCIGCIDSDCGTPIISMGCCNSSLTYCSNIGGCASSCAPPCLTEGQGSCNNTTCCSSNAQCILEYSNDVPRCRTCFPIGHVQFGSLPCCTPGGNPDPTGAYSKVCPEDGKCHNKQDCCPSTPYKCNGQCESCIADGQSCDGACCGTRCTDNVCRSCIPSGQNTGFCNGAQCCGFKCGDNTCRDCTSDDHVQSYCSKNGTDAPCCNYSCPQGCRTTAHENETYHCQKNNSNVDIPCDEGLIPCPDGICRKCIPINEDWTGCPDVPCCDYGYKCSDGKCHSTPYIGNTVYGIEPLCCEDPQHPSQLPCGKGYMNGHIQDVCPIDANGNNICGECSSCNGQIGRCTSCTKEGYTCNPPEECCAGLQRCLPDQNGISKCQQCTQDLHNCLQNDQCCCSWEFEFQLTLAEVANA